jgi:hypothetical protein
MNITNQTLQQLFYEGNNEIYLYDICKQFDSNNYSSYIIRFILLLFTYIGYKIINYYEYNNTNKVFIFFKKRIYYLHNNLYFVVTILSLEHIIMTTYTINRTIVEVIFFIILTLIIFINRHDFKEIIKNIFKRN